MEAWFWVYSTVFTLLLSMSLSEQHREVLIEYAPEFSSKWTSKQILDHALTQDDFEDMVEVMPDRQKVSFEITETQKIRLVFPLVDAGPLSFSIAPCYGNIDWTLSWRPPSMDLVEVVQNDSPNGNFTFHLKSNVSDIFTNKKDGKARQKRSRPRIEPLGLGRRLYKTKIRPPNFDSQLKTDTAVTYMFNGATPLVDITISNGSGSDPWLFSRDSVQPGLYMLLVTSSSSKSKFHGLASHSEYIYSKIGIIKAFSDRDRTNDHSLHLTWKSRLTGYGQSCLAISRKQLYSTLCSAKEAMDDGSPQAPDSSLIVGCIRGSEYNLPMTSRGKYHISIWNDNSLIPYVRAMVQPRPKRRLPRLKPGVMVSFTMHTGGSMEAVFISKRRRKLHVAAVSCVGGVKLLIMNGRQRVAAARGREALHLVVKHATRGKFKIRVSPDSNTMDHYRVHLVASHSAKKMPIPRLPRDVTVVTKPRNCSTATIKWSRAKGGSSYCVVLRHHPNGRPPIIRPPLQCGWEQAIRHLDYFYSVDCVQPEKKKKKQIYTKTGLQPGISYLVNILVKHPQSGRILALAPAMLTMPTC